MNWTTKLVLDNFKAFLLQEKNFKQDRVEREFARIKNLIPKEDYKEFIKEIENDL